MRLRTLTSLDLEFFEAANGFAIDLRIKMLLDIKFFNVQRHIRKIQSYIESLSITITSLSLGLLSAELFPPERFLEVLRGIQKHLPSTWHLAIPAIIDDTWTLYQGTRVLTAATVDAGTKEKNLRLLLHVTIYENALQFVLYQNRTTGKKMPRHQRPAPTMTNTTPYKFAWRRINTGD